MPFTLYFMIFGFLLVIEPNVTALRSHRIALTNAEEFRTVVGAGCVVVSVVFSVIVLISR